MVAHDSGKGIQRKERRGRGKEKGKKRGKTLEWQCTITLSDDGNTLPITMGFPFFCFILLLFSLSLSLLFPFSSAIRFSLLLPFVGCLLVLVTGAGRFDLCYVLVFLGCELVLPINSQARGAKTI
ncbi:hypothetical protein E2542_SST18806 [Spatholobus suberectus]|nr:hypothetical protein E2542_SST18806 [Spatholobus suberectus]